MEQLRELFEQLGFGAVETFIASGDARKPMFNATIDAIAASGCGCRAPQDVRRLSHYWAAKQ